MKAAIFSAMMLVVGICFGYCDFADLRERIDKFLAPPF